MTKPSNPRFIYQADEMYVELVYGTNSIQGNIRRRHIKILRWRTLSRLNKKYLISWAIYVNHFYNMIRSNNLRKYIGKTPRTFTMLIEDPIQQRADRQIHLSNKSFNKLYQCNNYFTVDLVARDWDFQMSHEGCLDKEQSANVIGYISPFFQKQYANGWLIMRYVTFLSNEIVETFVVIWSIFIYRWALSWLQRRHRIAMGALWLFHTMCRTRCWCRSCD